MKFSLLGHCQEWQNRFTSLLLKLATQTLQKLIVYFDENTQKVMVPPETHYDLDSSNKLLEALQANLQSVEDQFTPLNDQFNVLQKYEVAIPEEVKNTTKIFMLSHNLNVYFISLKKTMEMLKSLPTRWETYKQALVDAEEMLKKNKVCLKLNSFIIYFILINHNPMK